ncbi:hypothetical protein CVT26_008390 [Gymnopilus dilepis]|uniref:Core Histone H2A/H2B/H3 domain-containing protein n=1 Tax=Gymnopilus dilepis TaxID=231916 RepID=A0A409WCK6_9AGAR|nr:hypothetical protein CVT26_008390 [Gymnopilus dilepis]
MARIKQMARKSVQSAKMLAKVAKKAGFQMGHKDPKADSAKAPKTKPTKRKRARPGTVALREIRRYQASTDLLIPRAPFQRLVRELTYTFKLEVRFRPAALQALQEAAEAYVIEILEHANAAAVHAKRVTVQQKDLRFVCRIRGDLKHQMSW